jgi:cyclopropane-fatty-acyl-phospholipid synthase
MAKGRPLPSASALDKLIMKPNILPSSASPSPVSGDTELRGMDRLARKLILNLLAKIQAGELTIVERGQTHPFGTPLQLASPTPMPLATQPLRCEVAVHHPNFWRDVLLGGSVGAGESYIRGDWSCSDLTVLIRILLRNRPVLDKMDTRLSRIKAPLQRLGHLLRRNTRQGSRRNIEAHYDLGNDLFSLFLDPTLMYSSAIYPARESTLDQAAMHKLDHICQTLNLQPEDHVLEIGTGWGGFAVYAARHYGCQVTTTTISPAQHAEAQARVRAAGLEDQITLLLKDYRDLEGQYDKLVSIEMIEAIGHQYLDIYLKQCERLVRPGGEILIQAITIDDRQYAAALREVDFIKQYIFPGGFLPSVTALMEHMTRATQLQVVGLEDIGLHYARTLFDWRTRFLARLSEVRKLGYSDAFIRMWTFYLQYCEGAFLEHYISTIQLRLRRPAAINLDQPH